MNIKISACAAIATLFMANVCCAQESALDSLKASVEPSVLSAAVVPDSAPAVLTDAPKTDKAEWIIHVPAHYGILVYENLRLVEAGFYGARSEAEKDMNALLDALRRYGTEAAGSVGEDYWHAWRFNVAYFSGRIRELNGHKYRSMADAEKAALRITAGLQADGRRPLAPFVRTEVSDSGTVYAAGALYYESR